MRGKLACPVREGADGKGPEPRAPRRRPTSLGRGRWKRTCPTGTSPASYLAAKVAGRWRYLYRAVDQFGQVIDVLLSEQRDTAAARWFFIRALGHGPAPVEVTTDKAAPYLALRLSVSREAIVRLLTDPLYRVVPPASPSAITRSMCTGWCLGGQHPGALRRSWRLLGDYRRVRSLVGWRAAAGHHVADNLVGLAAVLARDSGAAGGALTVVRPVIAVPANAVHAAVASRVDPGLAG
jgi:hypothetical protein